MKSNVIALAAWAAVLLGHGLAHAAFAPIQPPICPATMEVPWTYNVSDQGTGEWELPNDQNTSSNYANHINNWRSIAGNKFIDRFGFRVDSFDLETNFDFLNYGTWDIDGNNIRTLTGSGITGWFDFDHALQSDRLMQMQFTSDFIVTRPGFSLGRARVCATDTVPVNGSPYLQPGLRTSGVLLGQGDVVFFSASVGSVKPGDACTKAHDTFALWGPQGADYDMYVRCGALPTDSSFTFRGFSGDSQEFIEAVNGSCPCGSRWYVAVHAFSNTPGQFNLVHSKHYATEHRPVARAAVSCSAPEATVANYSTQLGRGFRHYFGATEGTQFWDTVELRNNNNGPAMVYYRCNTGRPNAGRCEGDVEMYSDWFDGETLSHELGHHVSCVGDEYEDNKGTECGHSIMGSQFFANNNFCYCSNWNQGGSPTSDGRCQISYGDHSRDPSPVDLSATNEGPVWTNLKNRAPFTISSTPDNYDYTNFDFNGLFGRVVRVQ